MYEGEQDGTPVDPLPGYVPVRESPETNPELAKRYPLNIISPKSHALPQLVLRQRAAQDQDPGRAVRDDLAGGRGQRATSARAIRCACSNARGDFEGVARVTEDVNPGIVVATLGYWRSLNRSDGSVNSISSDAWSGIGRAPTFSDNLVEVARVN